MLAKDPYAVNNNVASLNGRDGYRLRVGNYRVIYSIDDGELVVQVLKVKPRGEVYK